MAHPAGRPDRSWRQCHGYLRRSHHVRRGPAGAILRAGKHLRQHRELADHRVQADRYQLPRPHSRNRQQQPARRQRDGAIRAATNTVQGDVQAASVSTYMAINGDGFFAVQKPGSFTDNNPIVRRRRQLHAPRRLHARQERLSRQRRRLLSEGIPIDPTTGNATGSDAAGSAIPERLPAGAADHQGRLSRQPCQLSADHEARHVGSGFGTAATRPTSLSNPRIAWHAAAAFSNTPIRGNSLNNYLDDADARSLVDPCSRARAGTNALPAGFANGDTLMLNDHHRYTRPRRCLLHGAASCTRPARPISPIGDRNRSATCSTTIDASTGNASPSSTFANGADHVAHRYWRTTLLRQLQRQRRRRIRGSWLHGHRDRHPVGRRHGGHRHRDRHDNSGLSSTSRSAAAPATAYDITGAPVSLQFRWAKIELRARPGRIPTNGICSIRSIRAPRAEPRPGRTSAPTSLSAPTARCSRWSAQITLTAPTVSGITLGNVTMNFGTGGLTQFADANGNAQVNQSSRMVSRQVSCRRFRSATNGRVVGNYSNGRNIDLAEITLATFNGAELPQAHRRRRVRGDRPVRRGPVRQGRQHFRLVARRHPTPTSPTNSPS